MRSIEQLERRVFLNGDVTAAFSNGDLFIRGDHGDNHVVVSQPHAGTIRVEGRDDTTVNGDEAVDFSGSLGDVRIHMRQGGEDTVEIQGPLQIAGDVNARMGAGELAIEGTVGPVEIAGDVAVRRGGEADVRLRNEVIVHGRAAGFGTEVTAASTPGILPDFPAASFSNPLNIDNPYLPWVVGTKYAYEETDVNDETGKTETETITVEVTNETRNILGVNVRVVRDIAELDGLVIEDTLDFYAQDDNGNVWYFGEETTSFEYDDEGNLIEEDTSGSFQAGENGARAGVVMFANPQVGNAYFQELLAGNAIDHGEVLSTSETLTTGVLGTSADVLETADTTALEPHNLEHKLYVPGFGLAQETKFDLVTGEEDGVVKLVSATQNGQPVTQVVPPDKTPGVNVTGTMTGPAKFSGDVSFNAEERAIARHVVFENNSYIASAGDVIVQDAEINDEPAFVAHGSVVLRRVTVAESVQENFVRAGEDVVIEDSTFQSTLLVRFSGSDDNDLIVGNSTFITLNADGGRGENTFLDLGENEYDQRVLKRFDVEVD